MERDKNWFRYRITVGTQDGFTDGDMLGTQELHSPQGACPHQLREEQATLQEL
jgi:hypothetical protein